ncbi:MAG TPA: hypothetical protein VNN07_08925, partial [Candidatus Tectomicrobia bacterium]|nr:hypothetical protein [Candidatus Tectomicrobia bacterium]
MSRTARPPDLRRRRATTAVLVVALLLAPTVAPAAAADDGFAAGYATAVLEREFGLAPRSLTVRQGVLR